MAIHIMNTGDTYGGGTIFYVDSTGQHGLIAAKADMPGHSVGEAEGHFIWDDARAACQNLVAGGYSDWFLPDKEQLNQLHLKKNVVGGFPGGIVHYWSSSEISEEGAWCHYFNEGVPSMDFKSNANKVRAVRAF